MRTDSQSLQRFEFVLLSMAKVVWCPSASHPLGFSRYEKLGHLWVC